MLILGLTGGIATGKSMVRSMMQRLGVPGHDADHEVKMLLAHDRETLAFVQAQWPKAIVQDKIDRQALGFIAFSNPTALRELESFLHPRVLLAQKKFILFHQRLRTPVVMLEVPLLFESGTDKLCDATVVLTAGASVQEQRALSRKGMTPDKLKGILERQMHEKERTKKATWILKTDQPRRVVFRQLFDMVQATRGMTGHSIKNWMAIKNA